VDAILEPKAGLQTSTSDPAPQRKERLLKPRVIAAVLLFLLAIAAALAGPDREVDPETAAYEAGRFSNAP
jgi:hypothetical protein